MSTADSFAEQVTQVTGENDFDPIFFDPNIPALVGLPYAYPYDDSSQGLTSPLEGLSGFSGDYEHHTVPFANQLEETREELYSFNVKDQYLSTTSITAAATASSTLNVESRTPPSDGPTPVCVQQERVQKEQKKTSTESKIRTTKTKKNLSPGKPAKMTPEARSKPKCDATKANNNHTKQLNEANTKSRCRGSLERNRVAASKCRKHKKEWTEALEEKKSGLEAIHSNLQAEHTNLSQELSQLKNLLISHASCQDPDISIWIKNAASKYVNSVQSPQKMNSPSFVPNLDQIGSLSKHSSTTGATNGADEPESITSPDLADFGWQN